jgi:hypothetical protein
VRFSRVLAVVFVIFTLLIGAARADCTSPPGEESVIVYNDTHKVMQFCDGERWISMVGGVGGGSGSGGDDGWVDVDLGDATNFDGACEYKFRVGTSWIWPHTVTPGYLLFDASTASFKFGAIEKGTKAQYWLRDEGNVAVTSGTPASVDEMLRNCVPDSEPEAFAFTDATNVELSTLTTAAPVTIGGINTAVSVTVSGAEISINGGAWGTSGTISNGQSLAVRLTSSAAFATPLSATIDVGGATDSWSVTSRAANTCPLPWGGSIGHNASVTGYQAASVACGNTCSSVTRSCNDGTLSNAGYDYGSCAVASCLTWVQQGASTCYGGSTWCPGGQTGNPTGVACSPAAATCIARCMPAGRVMSGYIFRCQ